MGTSKSAHQKLVEYHLEKVSRQLLEKKTYSRVIGDFVSGKSGIYLLYWDDHLQYVGLASDLPKRLSQHMKGRLGEEWNKFSIYITVNIGHMKELESLVMRITEPKGNRVRGKFVASKNLMPVIDKEVSIKQREERDGACVTEVGF